MALFVMIETPFTEMSFPLAQFNGEGWNKLVARYESENLDLNEPDAVRTYISLSVYDDEDLIEYTEGEARAALEKVGKRVDKLFVPLLSGREEGTLLGEP